MEEPDSIKEVKSDVKIKEIPEEDVKFTFTCKRCGGHSFKDVPASSHKFGGPGLSPSLVRVCGNCGFGEDPNADSKNVSFRG